MPSDGGGPTMKSLNLHWPQWLKKSAPKPVSFIGRLTGLTDAAGRPLSSGGVSVRMRRKSQDPSWFTVAEELPWFTVNGTKTDTKGTFEFRIPVEWLEPDIYSAEVSYPGSQGYRQLALTEYVDLIGGASTRLLEYERKVKR